jgi:hypothetical protein
MLMSTIGELGTFLAREAKAADTAPVEAIGLTAPAIGAASNDGSLPSSTTRPTVAALRPRQPQ